MFSESAELYDLIYSQFKDYANEARRIAEVLRSVNPACRTILDVGCGTGEHVRLLTADHGFVVDGLDLSEDFIGIARGKCPEATFVRADMSDFHLGKRYDAIVCLFSSIGYLLSLDRVERAFRCFREHLEPDGVVLLEPWFPPGKLTPGQHHKREVEAPGLKVKRESSTALDDRVSRLTFEYTIETADGVRHATEVHEMGLFTVDETLAAFRSAGLTAEHTTVFDRGLYVARPATG